MNSLQLHRDLVQHFARLGLKASKPQRVNLALLCQAFHRDWKSYGFDLERSQLDEAERLSVLMLAINITTLWMIHLGDAVLRCGHTAELAPPHDRLRGLSLGTGLCASLHNVEPPRARRVYCATHGLTWTRHRTRSVWTGHAPLSASA